MDGKMLEWLTLDNALRLFTLWAGFGILHFLISSVLLPRCNLPENTKAVRYTLAGNVIAAIFAMYVSGLGIEALLHLDDDFLYATYPPIINYSRVGFAYFTYDMVAMYKSFAATPAISQLSVLGRFKAFAGKRTSGLAHHICLAFFCIPFVAFVIYDKGHLVLAVVILHEASTPFLTAYLAMKQLQATHTRLFVVNAMFFLASFFVFRICAFPYLYWRYQRWKGLTGVVDTVLSVSWYCNAGSLAIASLQYYWFFEIICKIVAIRRRDTKQS